MVDALQGKVNPKPLCLLCKQLYKDYKRHHQIGKFMALIPPDICVPRDHNPDLKAISGKGAKRFS
jgi:hypothetical protein